MIAKVNWKNEFRRMMPEVLKNKWQELWVAAMLVVLLIGLLLSRAMASMASVLIVVPFLFSYRQVRIDEKKLVAVFLLLLPVLLSVSWSDNTTLWWNSLSVKLPLVTILLGLSAVSFTEKTKKQLVWICLLLVALGCCWSLWQYLQDTTAMEAAYLKAKTMPTPADNDHIRFSWMVIITIVFGVHSLIHEKQKIVRFLLGALLLFFVIYLHLLAAKTGLVGLYGGGFVYLLYVLFIHKKWKTALAGIAIVITTGWICYQTMPTLRNRIQYVVYDYNAYSQGKLMPGYNDASRILSMKAGYAIIREHALYGVGFGDMLASIDQWHTLHHPSSLLNERFLPANEWLVYGTGAGLLGILCFTAGFCLLLYQTTSRNALSLVLTATTLLPFLIDDTLEGQFGVLLLAFIAFFGQQIVTGSKHA